MRSSLHKPTTGRPVINRYEQDARYKNVARVSDLTYPLTIWHRGGGSIFPENTMEAYAGALAAGATAIEAGDIIAGADGSLVCMHDTTVDRTTTSTGNTATLSTMGTRRLVVDCSSWFGGGWTDTTVPLFDDVLRLIGGQAVIVPEVKDQLDATATKMVTRIKALGLQASTIVQSFTLSNLAIVTAQGIAACALAASVASSASAATLAAAGIAYAGIDYTTTGDLAGWITSMHAVGIKTIAFTVDHQVDYDTCIALGFDGMFSNDPLFVPRNYTAYRRAATTWAQNGTWGHGMARNLTPGPLQAVNRGSFVGQPGLWRFKPIHVASAVTGGGFFLPGEVVPIANAASSYTLTVVFCCDALPAATEGAVIYFCAAADSVTPTASPDVPSTYLAKVRQNGTISVFRIDPGSNAGKGSVTATAMSIPTLSSGLTAGVAVTTLPVNALTTALKIGHQFYLSTGQFVTLTAAAAVSATSLTVASVTPNAAVASGSSLLPRITITIAVTPTTITVSRADESSATADTFTDSTYRGAYAFFGAAVSGSADVSFESVTVS